MPAAFLFFAAPRFLVAGRFFSDADFLAAAFFFADRDVFLALPFFLVEGFFLADAFFLANAFFLGERFFPAAFFLDCLPRFADFLPADFLVGFLPLKMLSQPTANLLPPPVWVTVMLHSSR